MTVELFRVLTMATPRQSEVRRYRVKQSSTRQLPTCGPYWIGWKERERAKRHR